MAKGMVSAKMVPHAEASANGKNTPQLGKSGLPYGSGRAHIQNKNRAWMAQATSAVTKMFEGSLDEVFCFTEGKYS
jgi:hypothetical protein